MFILRTRVFCCFNPLLLQVIGRNVKCPIKKLQFNQTPLKITVFMLAVAGSVFKPSNMRPGLPLSMSVMYSDIKLY